jgi:hypothetical protein
VIEEITSSMTIALFIQQPLDLLVDGTRHTFETRRLFFKGLLPRLLWEIIP